MQEIRANEEIEIDVKEIFYLLLSKLWMIVLVGVVAAIGCFMISKFCMTPVYKAQTKIYIYSQESSQSNITVTDLQMGSQLTKDYKELITCRPVVESVIKSLKLTEKYESLSSRITVDIPADTRIIGISVDDTDPVMAMKLTNSIRESASRHIKDVMEIISVNVVEEATVPEKPYKPNNRKHGLLGGLAGAFLVIVIILIRFLLDDSIKSPDDIEKRLGLSNLASIPLMETATSKRNRKHKKK